MANRDPSNGNHIEGPVNGMSVQAGSIHGGVHVDQSRIIYQSVYVERRRTNRPLDILSGLVIMSAAGTTAMAIPGFFTVVTGQIFASQLPWWTAAPALAVFGVPYGLVVALFTLRGQFLRLWRRALIFVGAGAVILPLAFAFPDEQHVKVGVAFYFGGAILLPILGAIFGRKANHSR